MSIAIVAKEPVNIYHYTSGQEYYQYALVKVLPRFGFKVDFLTIDQLLARARRYGEYSSYHLYYLGFRDVAALRRALGGKRLIYHVYHVEDATWTGTHQVSWKVFLASLQFLVDGYLATARSVCGWLKLRAPLAKCLLVEPYYECGCNSFHKLKRVVAGKFSGEEVRLLYIGRLSSYRSPPSKLLEIARGVARRVRRRVKLTIVSKIALKRELLKYSGSNVTLEFINDRIDDSEKCKLYRESHFFIYLARGNVAMNPPITLLESVYHGVIPIVSSWVLNDIEVPPDLVADSVEEVIDRITSLWSDPERINKIAGYLQKSFRRFYDVSRFVEAIRRTL